MEYKPNYKTLGTTWYVQEDFAPAVTLSMPEWRKWISSGKNTLYAGAIIPGGTEGGSGWTGDAVYSGHVRVPYGWQG